MTITKTQENGKSTLAIDGRLDTSSAPRLQEALAPAFDDAEFVELDFANITYVSSAGLRVLLSAEKIANAKNASMTLVNVSPDVKEIFEMTGFSNILKIV
jgi:anti-anti-sigma factor